jgi:hypothetical protein
VELKVRLKLNVGLTSSDQGNRAGRKNVIALLDE